MSGLRFMGRSGLWAQTDVRCCWRVDITTRIAAVLDSFVCLQSTADGRNGLLGPRVASPATAVLQYETGRATVRHRATGDENVTELLWKRKCAIQVDAPVSFRVYLFCEKNPSA